MKNWKDVVLSSLDYEVFNSHFTVKVDSLASQEYTLTSESETYSDTEVYGESTIIGLYKDGILLIELNIDGGEEEIVKNWIKQFANVEHDVNLFIENRQKDRNE